jgi:hypothetical protein
MINNNDHYIHVAIPKTASQSLSAALGNSPDSHPEPAIYHNTLEHYMATDYNKYMEYFKFTIVRNPWSRLWSLWKDFAHVRRGQYSYNVYDQSFLAEFRNFYQLCLGLKNSIWSTNIFFRPQLSFVCYGGTPHMDYIGRFEELPNSIDSILHTLHKPLVKVPHLNKSASPDYRRLYLQNKDCIDAVGDFYHVDIKEFQYEF